MMDVFVSYKAEDRARITPLVRALESDGIAVWWDAHIGAGDQWRETILHHLEAAKCVLVVWSKRSVGPNGEFVRDEAARALKRKTYLPVRIDRIDPPLGFGEVQALDLTGWRGDSSDQRYEAVLSALRARLGAKAKKTRAAATERHGIDRRMVIAGASAAAVVGAGAGAWYFLRTPTTKSNSIAVLPFENLSGDPRQAYFSDGIAEELRSRLTRISGLKVIGRTSSEAVRNYDARTASRRLGVNNILTGSVRRSAATIRVSAELIDGRSGVDRWSQDYDRAPGDLIKIQTDIAANVAEALSVALGAVSRTKAIGGTENAAAQNLLLQAVADEGGLSKDKLLSALSLVDGALTLDPAYAEAYVVKARILNLLANVFSNATDLQRYRRQALANVRKALQLTPELGSAHVVLGEFFENTLQFRDTDKEYKMALRLGGSDAEALRTYALFASKLGRSSEALRLSQVAVALDPLNSQSLEARFLVLLNNRQFDQAIAFSREVQQKSPTLFQWSDWYLMCLIASGRLEEARKIIRATHGEWGVPEAILLARDGNVAASQQVIDRIANTYGDAASYQYAEIYAQIGDRSRAFAALDHAWQVRDSGLGWAKVDPMLDPLRSDPRFLGLVKNLDFPA